MAHTQVDKNRSNHARGVLWSAGGPLLRLVAQLGVQAILARLLSPADYGVFAIVLLTTTFVTFLSELGGAALLVKAEQLDDRRIGVALALQLTIGALVTAMLYLLAVPIASWFGKPEAVGPLQSLAWNPLIVMAGITAMRLLARAMAFREIQLLTFGSYVFGYAGVSVVGAWLGWGVDALVFGTLSQSMLQTVGAYAMVRHTLMPCLDGKLVREQASFGSQTLASGLVTWALFSLDRAFVGRFQSAHAAGLYAAAFNLAVAPLWQVVSSLGQHMFSAASKQSGQPAELGRMLSRSVCLILLLALPAMSTLAAAAPEFTRVIYGERWLPAAEPIAFLALAMPFYAIYHMASPIFWARGEVWRDVTIQAFTLLLLGACLVVSENGGLAAAGGCVLGVYVLRALVALAVSHRALGPGHLDRGAIARAFFTAGAAALAIFAVAWGARHMLSHTLATIALTSFAAALCGAMQLMLLRRHCRHAGLRDAVDLVWAKLAARLPLLR